MQMEGMGETEGMGAITVVLTRDSKLVVLKSTMGRGCDSTYPLGRENGITGILTDEAISCGTLSKGSEKRKENDEGAKSRGSWKDKKMEAVDPDHLKSTCPKLGRAPRQAGNQLAIEGNRGSKNNGNAVRGRAYNVNVNADEASRDPNVVTGTFSLNNHFATVLFDSGADFSFISTEFASMLNVKPRIVNPGYVIEIADGKRVEVNRVICDCKLELEFACMTLLNNARLLYLVLVPPRASTLAGCDRLVSELLVIKKVEERLTIELAEGREVEKIVTTVTKNRVVTRYPGKFQEYQLTDIEKEMERMMMI
ncbi:reverse transcriptase domain-containing protein [Tanacetum coccineum]